MKIVRRLLRKTVDRLQFRSVREAEMIGQNEGAWCVSAKRLASVKKPTLFSGGAGNNITFEEEFIERFGGVVFLYDPSPTGKYTVENRPPIEGLHFIPKALSGRCGPIKMSRPNDPREGSWTVPSAGDDSKDEFESVSLLQEITTNGYDKVDILKLDIEGFEYEVLEEVLNAPLYIGQILVEFHDFFPHISGNQTREMLRLLKQRDYKCFYKDRHDFSFYKT